MLNHIQLRPNEEEHLWESPQLKPKVSNPADRERFAEIRFTVDSGAAYSVVPASILDRLGIEADTTQEFSSQTAIASSGAWASPLSNIAENGQPRPPFSAKKEILR